MLAINAGNNQDIALLDNVAAVELGDGGVADGKAELISGRGGSSESAEEESREANGELHFEWRVEDWNLD